MNAAPASMKPMPCGKPAAFREALGRVHLPVESNPASRFPDATPLACGQLLS